LGASGGEVGELAALGALEDGAGTGGERLVVVGQEADDDVGVEEDDWYPLALAFPGQPLCPVFVGDLLELFPGAGGLQTGQRHVQLVQDKPHRVRPHPAVLHLETHPVFRSEAQQAADLRRDGDLPLGADTALQVMCSHRCTFAPRFYVRVDVVPRTL
jgi:hypothetical protein